MERTVRPVGGRRGVLITTLICLTPIVSHAIGRSLYGLLLEEVRDELGLTNTQAGWPSSAIFAMYVVGVLAVVVLSPRVAPITIMRAALAISAFGLFITATAQGLIALTIGVALVGGAGAGIWMSAPVLATEYVSERRRGVVIGSLTSTMGGANILFGVGTTAWRDIANNDQLWRPIWWVAFGFTVALFAALAIFGRFSPTDRVQNRFFDISIVRQVTSWKEVTIAYALFGGMSAGFGTFIVLALTEHGDVAKSTASLVFSAMGVASLLASPIAGAISDRIGRITMLRATLLLLLAANLAVSLGGAFFTIAGALMYSAGASTFPALIASHVRDSLDSRAFSQALAIMTILFAMMGVIMPLVVGRLGDVSFGWSYLVLAALPLLGFAVLARTPQVR